MRDAYQDLAQVVIRDIDEFGAVVFGDHELQMERESRVSGLVFAEFGSQRETEG